MAYAQQQDNYRPDRLIVVKLKTDHEYMHGIRFQEIEQK